MIFKRDIECSRCNRIILKKEIQIIDTRNDGRNKLGVKRYVCKDCVEHEIYKVLNENKYKAVLIHPMKKFNSYVYYNFSELLQEPASEELANDLERILPKANQYCSCGNRAQYSWCSPEIFDNDPWNWKVIDNEVKIEFLCKECAFRKILGTLQEGDIDIKYLYPYIKSEGFFTPWDV
ncbi:hypothetical protein KHQ81_11955 [Mycoplasmatota bacterium]|nr:hypothetical protein KHQ81_11955 [Mycoplasmatota bacterium]